MKQFFCELLFLCTVAAPGAKPVDELTYGTVLYEYFQEQHSDALLTALVAQAQDRRGEDWVRFDLAAGSFAFADGMYDYANETFARVGEGELTELDSMRLAFHLSREYHRRQAWESLDSQLAKIDLGKSWLGRVRVHPEVEFMKAELAVQRGDLDAAYQMLSGMDQQNSLTAYGLFNLGVAYREANLLPNAKQTFAHLAALPAYSDEAYDLSQRAKLALALIARQQQDRQSADAVLRDLPGQGRYQEVAMAAFGGLAMDNEDYELAARIWMTLQDDAYWTPSTATARLGFPLSLERMAATSQRATTEMALMQYQQAEASFTGRLDELTALSTQARDPAWVHGLLDVFATEEQDQAQMQALMQQWQDQLGHTDWLEWLATDKVHQVLVQWRELNAMQGFLGELPDRLSALEGVATEQQRRADKAVVLLQDDGILDQRVLLQGKVKELQQQLAVVDAATPERTQTWMQPLATVEERELLDELSQMRALIAHMDERDQIKWRARVERLEGLVFYRIVDERAKRLQVLRKQHQELNVVLADLDQRVTRVNNAEENFVAGVGTDFAAFLERSDRLIARVAAARLDREELLAAEIRGRMEREMRQVQQYLLVTRIAIARATDLLALAPQATDSAEVMQ
jgi:hypothetical protein